MKTGRWAYKKDQFQIRHHKMKTIFEENHWGDQWQKSNTAISKVQVLLNKNKMVSTVIIHLGI